MRKYIKFPEFRNLFSAADELTCKQLENDGHDRLQRIEDFFPFERLRPAIEKSIEVWNQHQQGAACQQAARTFSSAPRPGTELFPHPSAEQSKTPNGSSNRGRPAVDPVLMFKICFLIELFNLSVKQVRADILDRASYRKFLNLGTNCCPARQTIWKYYEIFSQTGLIVKVSSEVMAAIRQTDAVKQDSAIIGDSSYLESPTQHFSSGDYKKIKAGRGQEIRFKNRHQACHKDLDARRAMKGNKFFHGYKMHVIAASASKFIIGLEVTNASVHDSQVVAPLLREEFAGKGLFLDAGYFGAAVEDIIKKFKMVPRVCQRATRGHPLSLEQKHQNRQISKVRVRIEHIFGFIEKSMNGSTVRTVGIIRATAHAHMKSLCYNICRATTLIKLIATEGIPPKKLEERYWATKDSSRALPYRP